jgi:uncharacterized membrane protein YtjA (UPF0391 family)
MGGGVPVGSTDRWSSGFIGIALAVAAAAVAKLLFVFFLVLFPLSLFAQLTRRGSGSCGWNVQI